MAEANCFLAESQRLSSPQNRQKPHKWWWAPFSSTYVRIPISPFLPSITLDLGSRRSLRAISVNRGPLLIIDRFGFFGGTHRDEIGLKKYTPKKTDA